MKGTDGEGGRSQVNCLLFDSADQEALEKFIDVMYEYRGLNFDPLKLHSDIRQID